MIKLMKSRVRLLLSGALILLWLAEILRLLALIQAALGN
jgi:hypothetical protein